MKKLHVNISAKKSKKYPVFVGTDILFNLKNWLPDQYQDYVIITDTKIKKTYALPIAAQLKQQGKRCSLLTILARESSKNYTTVNALHEKLLRLNANKNTLILAIGGGVIGDIAGFTAATFMRGIAYIQIPTTLLAMLDSSVGGKTGINSPLGKNMIGAYWQPEMVITDLQCLKTLTHTHFINGLIEAIKIFLTCDKNSFNNLVKKLNSILSVDLFELEKIISKAIQLKARIVEKDERDGHIRHVLNFGHTIGHALEKMTNYQLLHGYAVGLGILLEAEIACLLGHLSRAKLNIIKELFKKLGIHPEKLRAFSVSKLMKATQLDKKNHGLGPQYVILKSIGSVVKNKNKFTHTISDTLLKQAYATLLEKPHGRK